MDEKRFEVLLENIDGQLRFLAEGITAINDHLTERVDGQLQHHTEQLNADS